MKLALLLSLILSGIQANNNTNVSTSRPEAYTNASTTSNISPVILKSTASIPIINTGNTVVEVSMLTWKNVQKDNQLQACMFQSVSGKNLNISKILQNNYKPKVSYKMFFGVPRMQKCTINITIDDSIKNVNDKINGSIYLKNVARENCTSSLPETPCSETSMCKKILKCCNDTKIEEVDGCNYRERIEKCNTRGMSKCVLLTELDVPINNTYNPGTFPWSISTTPNSAATTGSQMITFIIAFIVTNILR